ncbi:MAG: hypothetical protein EOO36_21125 [Cytophagaceae bacterium]|nr:MAG: hypothetical protein EOO36_21125 [Cytophagaceae bacterium]
MNKTCSLAASLLSVAGALLLAACDGPASPQVADAPVRAVATKAPAPLPNVATPSGATGAAVPFVGQPGVGATLRAAAANGQ